MEGVDEIGVETVLARRNAGKQRVVAHHLERVPAHVRDFQLRVGGRDLHHVAGNPAEPVDGLLLQPALGHELAADANAEEGLSAPDHLLLQRLDHAGDRAEAAPAIGEGADARQHDPLGAGHHIGIGGHDDRVAGVPRSALEGLCGGVQVARAVIDDGDAHRSGSGKRPRIGSSASERRTGMKAARAIASRRSPDSRPGGGRFHLVKKRISASCRSRP